MLESLFGNPVIEKILFTILKNEETYASKLSRNFEVSLFSFQVALDRLESGRVLMSKKVGKTRLYSFNPRYPFLSELVIFLEKAYSFLPDRIRFQYYEKITRKRPRRKGKPL